MATGAARATARSRRAASEDLVASGRSTSGRKMPRGGSGQPAQAAPVSAEVAPAPAPAPPREAQQPSGTPSGININLPQSGAAHDASWAVLAFLTWGWIVMPFLKGGPGEVKKVLMAKFLNKRPDGSYFS
jgi:hypothetical protein